MYLFHRPQATAHASVLFQPWETAVDIGWLLAPQHLFPQQLSGFLSHDLPPTPTQPPSHPSVYTLDATFKTHLALNLAFTVLSLLEPSSLWQLQFRSLPTHFLSPPLPILFLTWFSADPVKIEVSLCHSSAQNTPEAPSSPQGKSQHS